MSRPGPCPRCDSADVDEQHTGLRDGRPVWHVLHCARCSFTWRTNEPVETVNPVHRPRDFQLDGGRLAALADHLPAMR